MPTPSNADNNASRLPSPEVRGWVSLFLFIHLFCVVIALAAYTYPSPLEERLRTVLAPYLVTFNFDLNPNVYPAGRFFLTHGTELDIDFEVIVRNTDASADGPETVIPAQGLWPPARRRHYQALANTAGSLTSSDSELITPVLPTAIAGSILRHEKAKRGIISIVGHRLMEIQDVNSPDATKSDPFSKGYYHETYEADVLVSATGQVDLHKKSNEGEVAPVKKNAK